MSLVVVGSIAFDAVKTPFGERDRMLGGSAVHFSLAASFFCDVRIVGPVGDDFGDDEYRVLHERDINTDDVEHVEGGRTFFWRGTYEYDLNTAHTEETELGVFGDFEPKLSNESKQAEHLFLANIQPELQLRVREQCRRAHLTGLDSMNLWIDTERDALERAIGRADLLFLNDAEVRMFSQEPNLVRAARKVMRMGPGVIVAKQGEYGAALFVGDRFFALPAFPLDTVQDPTGAGDSFAGGFLGYLSSRPDDALTDQGELRRAMTYGSVLASFNVEEFGTERVARLTRKEIDERYSELRRMTSLAELPA
ncbi:MAG: PfkB family carbohydrate kinase [Thermoleophilaceae bacterium]